MMPALVNQADWEQVIDVLDTGKGEHFADRFDLWVSYLHAIDDLIDPKVGFLAVGFLT